MFDSLKFHNDNDVLKQINFSATKLNGIPYVNTLYTPKKLCFSFCHRQEAQTDNDRPLWSLIASRV